MRGEPQRHGERKVPLLKDERLRTDGGENDEQESDTEEETNGEEESTAEGGGGEEASSEEEESNEEAEGSDEEESAEDEESAEGEEAEEGEEGEDDEGTTVLYLDLEGLFLNLLGLEVDLNEIELDISAVPRPGALLGNLLSGVAGLVDKNPLDSLRGVLPDFDLPSISDFMPDESDISEMGYRVVNEFLDMLLDTLGEDESTDEEVSES
ncbi:hypothetical protein [Haladaptatus salinisoli]|uniref:hypothetical protein n=1 Tax=Haladaptatus salinisoli TaxID=2884876 RepID=UPI001D09B221|nr:hypothetical protein [Haladaptatus salinisoli]